MIIFDLHNLTILKNVFCVMPLLVHTPLLPRTPPSGHYADLLDCIQTFLLHFLNSRIELLRDCDVLEEEIEPPYFRMVPLIPEP
jgi:hypothetical protein